MGFVFVRVGVSGLPIDSCFSSDVSSTEHFYIHPYKAFTLLNLQLVDYGLHKSIAFRHAVLLNSIRPDKVITNG